MVKSRIKRKFILITFGLSPLAIGVVGCTTILPTMLDTRAFTKTNLNTLLSQIDPVTSDPYNDLTSEPFGSNPDFYGVLEHIRLNMINHGGFTASTALSINDVQVKSGTSFNVPVGQVVITPKDHSVQYTGEATITWSVTARVLISTHLKQTTFHHTDTNYFLSQPTNAQVLRALKNDWDTPAAQGGNHDLQLNQVKSVDYDYSGTPDQTTGLAEGKCWIVPIDNSVVYTANNPDGTDKVQVFFYYFDQPVPLNNLITDTNLAFQDIPTELDLKSELIRDNTGLQTRNFTADDLIITNLDPITKTATVTATNSALYTGSVNISWTVNPRTDIASIFIYTNLYFFIDIPPTPDDIWVYARNANTNNNTNLSDADWQVLHDSVTITVNGTGTNGTATMTAISTSTRYSGSATFNWYADQRENIADVIRNRALGPITWSGALPSITVIQNAVNIANRSVTIDWTQLTISDISATGAKITPINGSLVYDGGPVSITFSKGVASLDGSDWVGHTAGKLDNYEIDEVNHTITYLNNGGSNFTATDLEIPDAVNIGGVAYKVIGLGGGTLGGSDALGNNLTGKLKLGSYVTTIDADAFKGCNLLSDVAFTAGVTYIGLDAFKGCTNLLSASEADGKIFCGTDNIYYIKSGTSTYCLGKGTNVMSTGSTPPTGQITLRTDTRVIAHQAFSYCSISGNLYIPATVVAINDAAFYECTSLSGTLNLNSVKAIGEEAFYNCSGLIGDLNIPTGVTEIAKDTFYGCSGFNGNLILPNTITNGIGWKAFYGCDGLVSATVDANNKISKDANNIYYIRNNTDYYCLGKGANIGDATSAKPTGPLSLKTNTKVIASNAFDGCDTLTGALNIPNTVVAINHNAFSGCRGFTGNLSIPTSIKKMGDGAFSYCSGLTGTLTLQNNITEIENDTFWEAGFTTVVLPDALTKIGSDAFYLCTNLTNINVPTNLISIGTEAFANTSLLAGSETNNKIFLDTTNNIYYLKGTSKYYCLGQGNSVNDTSTSKPTGQVNILNNTAVIADGAFENCTGLSGNIILPTGLFTIGRQSFYGCSGLDGDLTIPNSVNNIGDSAFVSVDFNTIHLLSSWTHWSFQEWWKYGAPGANPLVISGYEWTVGNIYVDGTAY